MFVFDVLAQSIGLVYAFVYSLLFSMSSSLFIEELRDVENLAVTSMCLQELFFRLVSSDAFYRRSSSDSFFQML